MAETISTARLAYNIERSLLARARGIQRQRGELYGVNQRGDTRAQARHPKPKAKPKNGGLDTGGNGEKAELDLVAEIEGTGIGRSVLFGDEGPGPGPSPTGLPESPGERLSRLRQWKRDRARSR